LIDSLRVVARHLPTYRRRRALGSIRIEEEKVKKLLLRLSGSLVAVLGLWTLVWLPLVLGQTSEPQEEALGSPNAPVTIIEYASLTCPHCAHFQKDVLPKLKERYIATGKVRLVYRDFPLDQRALAASVLAHCAGPDRYFGFLDVLFQTQETWAGADDYVAALKRIGKLGGLTESQMDACFADQKLNNQVLQSRLDAQNQHNVSSTPTFIIDGKTYAGARDINEFASLIDPLLQKS
jgi:protein-disulfide isomerase